jgi:hypothetical protein
MKTQQEIEKKFDKKFGEVETYVSPSDYNEHLLEIKYFIYQIRQDDIKSLIGWAEKRRSWGNDAGDFLYNQCLGDLINFLQSQLKELN